MVSNNKRFSLEELNGRPLRLLIGGSPCTHWSIAQKNNRETKPEGLGWELFENYLIAKRNSDQISSYMRTISQQHSLSKIRFLRN